MKILLVNTYDTGGAANACIRLHKALIAHGHSSKILVLHKTVDIPNMVAFKSKGDESQSRKILKRALDKLGVSKKKRKSEEQIFRNERSINLEYFSLPYSEYDITQSELYKEADVINLHWVAQFLDYKSFFKKNKKPVVWTLHDMSPFLGGEHYEERYDGIDESGIPKPRIISSREDEMFNDIIKEKLEIFNNVSNLTIISPSMWLKKEAEKSSVFGEFECAHIPNTIDSDVYTIFNKNESQQLFDINCKTINVLFVSQSLSNSRKGMKILAKAIKSIGNERLRLYTVGLSNKNDFNSTDITSLGTINDEVQMSKVYNAVDVFILPSLMDNLPNTALESCMCGTPVIGFNIGGISEIIEDGYNGVLVDNCSAEDLRDGIKKILEIGVKWSREEIRENSLKKYNSKLVVGKYVDVYKKSIIL